MPFTHRGSSLHFKSLTPPKIESMQNVILMRRDIPSAWEDKSELGVDPAMTLIDILPSGIQLPMSFTMAKDDYKITAFISGLGDVHGRPLQLDHISHRGLRPLDELF